MTDQIRERATAVLPQGAHEFLRRRAAEAVGLALAIIGALLALALLTYRADDPSWNHAASHGPRNLMGVPGAYAADVMLQTLGLAGALIPALLLSWAWRLFSHQGLPRLWVKLTLVPFALLFAAALAASLSPPVAWPLTVGLGGVLGAFVRARLGALELSVAPT